VLSSVEMPKADCQSERRSGSSVSSDIRSLKTLSLLSLASFDRGDYHSLARAYAPPPLPSAEHCV
jgi:hypothetical protein